jgi:large subunit ribosomal protein L4
MIDVPVYDMSGKQTGTVDIDEAVLGGEVRFHLLKQAVVMWLANQRQGSARTKSRGMVRGSTRKLYRQKGTGNARMGANRTCIRRGGGVAFAKTKRPFQKDMPKKMRRLARNSALLAKLQAGNVAVVNDMKLDAPKTKALYSVLKAVGADQGCVIAMDSLDDVLFKSGRNIPKTEIRQVTDLNAYEILRRKKLVFTKPAFDAVVANPETFKPAQASA